MRLTYLEIPASDPARSARFYEAVAGWTIDVRPDGDPRFEDAEAKLIGRFVAGREPSAGGMLTYLYVDDLDVAVLRATSAGGGVVEAPRPEGDVLVARVRDPAGNVVGLWQFAARPASVERPQGTRPLERPQGERPPFVVSSADVPEATHVYPQSDEPMGPTRRVGKAAGLLRIGVNVQRLPPGTRSSWPHAEEDEEEFVYVLEGEVDAWIDGHLHRMVPGDFAAFPAGTGISHAFLNNGTADAVLLVGGEAPKSDSRIYYPLNPSRRKDMVWSHWWDDVPARPLGPHDGLPDARRRR